MKKLKNLTDGMTVGVAILAITMVIILALSIVFGALCLEAGILMLLWNAVVPALWVSAPKLSFWLSMGLILICNILFKSVHSCTHKKE